MKTLITGLILLISASHSSTKNTEDYSWVLEEMKGDVEMLFEDLDIADSKIMIFNINGDLVGQYSEGEVIENSLPLPDLQLLLNSEFLFEYGGESYYLES